MPYKRSAKPTYRVYKFTRGPVGDIKISLAADVTFDDKMKAESIAYSMRRNRLHRHKENLIVASDIKEAQRLASEKNIVQKNIFGGRSKVIRVDAS